MKIRFPVRSNILGDITLLPAGAGTSAMAIAALLFVTDGQHVRINHLFHERIKTGFVAPSKGSARFRSITQESIHLGWPEIPRVHLDEQLAGRLVDPFFI